MSIALDLCCLIFPVAIPNSVELSTWTGVGGWECSISSSVIRMGTSSWKFKNKAHNSASAADAMMLRSILHTTYAIPFSVGSKSAGLFGDRGLSLKKCIPPALLRVFGQYKWEESLWTHKTTSLRLYRMVASGFGARSYESTVMPPTCPSKKHEAEQEACTSWATNPRHHIIPTISNLH